MPNILEIFSKSFAQVIDATAQPTWGSITTSNITTQNASITLAASKTNLLVGETTKVSIEIKTNTNQINEYRIFLSFDPNRLKVIDKDPNTPGTQIQLLDQLYTVTNAATDNLVTGGEIKLIAKTPSGNAFQVNRVVAEVEFQAQSNGTTTVQVVQGSGKSSLVRANGTTLNFSVNSQILTISTEQNQNNNLNNNQSSNRNIEQIPIPDVTIPDTSISLDAASNISIILLGVLFIATGISLRKDKKK